MSFTFRSTPRAILSDRKTVSTPKPTTRQDSPPRIAKPIPVLSSVPRTSRVSSPVRIPAREVVPVFEPAEDIKIIISTSCVPAFKHENGVIFAALPEDTAIKILRDAYDPKQREFSVNTLRKSTRWGIQSYLFNALPADLMCFVFTRSELEDKLLAHSCTRLTRCIDAYAAKNEPPPFEDIVCECIDKILRDIKFREWDSGIAHNIRTSTRRQKAIVRGILEEYIVLRYAFIAMC
jgi:hypothetical protein